MGYWCQEFQGEGFSPSKKDVSERPHKTANNRAKTRGRRGSEPRGCQEEEHSGEWEQPV